MIQLNFGLVVLTLSVVLQLKLRLCQSTSQWLMNDDDIHNNPDTNMAFNMTRLYDELTYILNTGDINDVSQLNESQSKIKRAVYPGTAWCGVGRIVLYTAHFGHYKHTDMCCRAHDLCPRKKFKQQKNSYVSKHSQNNIPSTTTESTEPTTTESPEPTTTESPKPTTTESTKPTTTESPEPTTTESPKPTTAKPTEPTTTESPKPTTSKPTEPTTLPTKYLVSPPRYRPPPPSRPSYPPIGLITRPILPQTLSHLQQLQQQHQQQQQQQRPRPYNYPYDDRLLNPNAAPPMNYIPPSTLQREPKELSSVQQTQATSRQRRWSITTSDCECDRKFYTCLRNVNNIVSRRVGKLYFNIFHRRCRTFDHPISGCLRRQGILGWRCVEYEVDTTQPMDFQMRDNPYFFFFF